MKIKVICFLGEAYEQCSWGQHARMNREEGRGIWPRNPEVLEILLKAAVTVTSTILVILRDAKLFSECLNLPRNSSFSV